jgi:predicted ATPase/class 3 adenylate cyclase
MSLDLLGVYLPQDRRQALARGAALPDRTVGTALYVDVVGFTSFTEALVRLHGPRRGADVLIGHMNQVYDTLIAQVEHYGGSVVGFSGDAMTCWFDAASHSDDQQPSHSGIVAAQRAAGCALAMHSAICALPPIALSDGASFPPALKVVLASGPVRRFLVGDPQIQALDVLIGATLDRLAAAEKRVHQGEVLLDRQTAQQLADQATVGGWRAGETPEAQFAVLSDVRFQLPASGRRAPTPVITDLEALRSFVAPFVYERLRGGLGEFLTELRPAVALFLRFDGIDYGRDDADSTLDGYIRWIQDVLAQYDGTLLQVTIGEKGSYVYTVFGAPIAHEDDARRAVLAAKALCAPPNPAIHAAHIGISQGIVRAGAYGGTTRRTYGVQGEAVNIAARLMQHAAPHEILVSESIQAGATADFVWDSLKPLMVKGRRTPLRVARLLDAHTMATERQPTYALIGRAVELTQARRALAPIFTDAFAGIISIYGEPGIGKSRLAHELRRQLTTVAGAAAMHAAAPIQWFMCPADGLVRASLHPFRAFLRRYFDQDAAISEAENKERFEAILDDLIADLDATAERQSHPERATPGSRHAILATELRRTRSFLGASVDLHWAGSLYERMEPQLRFENTLGAITTLVRAESLRRPLALHLEDAHWLDEDSLRLLQTLTRDAADFPFAVLMSSRPGDDGQPLRAPVDDDVPQHIIGLGPLSSEHVRSHAAQVLGGPVDETLTDFFVVKTGGNPFFTEQLALDMRERELLAEADGAYQLASALPGDSDARRRSLDLDELPANINAVLVARLDRMAPQLKAVVQTAAVLGVEFEAPVLSRLLSHVVGVTDQVQRAESEAVWRQVSHTRYMFRHVLLRDAAYALHDRDHLRDLHSRAAQLIEIEYAQAPDTHYPTLVYHYRQAENPERERHYARLAGERAATRYANAEAIGYFTRALELTPQPAAREQFDILLDRAQVYRWLSDRSGYGREIGTLETLAEAVDEGRRVKVVAARAFYHYSAGEYAAAQTQGERAVRISREINDQHTELAALSVLGAVAWSLSKYAEAHQHYARVLTLAQAVGDRRRQSLALSDLSAVSNDVEEYTRSRTYLEESLAIARAIGDLSAENLALNNLGVALGGLGDLAAARDCYDQSLVAARKSGAPRREMMALHNLSKMAKMVGQYETGWSLGEQSLRLARNVTARESETYILNNLADILTCQEAYDNAANLYEESVALSRAIGYPRGESGALWGLGNIALARGDSAAALDAHMRALLLRREDKSSTLIAESLAGTAQALLQCGDIVAALAQIADIITILKTHTLSSSEAPGFVHFNCYQVLRAANDPRAATLLDEGYNFIMARAAKIRDASTRRSHLENVPWLRALLAAWSDAQLTREVSRTAP